MRRMMSRGAALAAALAVLPALLGAQTSEKDILLQDWTRFHGNVRKYVEAMPDSGIASSPTTGVRTFAEQIEHIVGSNVYLAATASVPAHKPPSIGDKAVYLKDKKALLVMVDSGFNHSIAMLKALTPAALGRDVTLFGQTMTASRWFRTMHEHGVWTLGQTVPYLRMKGASPPGYLPF